MKKSERRKLHSLPPKQVKEVREKQQASLAISRKEWRARYQKRARWGKNDYSDDDFISKMLVKWPFALLLEYSKLLVLLINRRSLTPAGDSLPQALSSLIYYKYPCEYRDTLFAQYTYLRRDEERILNFGAYYTEIYKEAVEHARQPDETLRLYPWLTRHHCGMLKACFLVALTYEPRIRRFVFCRHDIHYDYLKSHPPPIEKSRQFIAEIQSYVNHFIEAEMAGAELATLATDLWLAQYMFRID